MSWAGMSWLYESAHSAMAGLAARSVRFLFATILGYGWGLSQSSLRLEATLRRKI